MHLDALSAPGPDAFVFCRPDGRPFSAMKRSRAWRRALPSWDLDLTVHDLRHTGNMLAARTAGTTTKDLMARLGHATAHAAILYQHASHERDTAIAAAVGRHDRARDERSMPHAVRLR